MKATQSKPEGLPAQIIGNIGLFHVCCELSRRGLNVVPTSRNTKSVDVIVGTADFSKHATIQVKTSTTNLGARVASRKTSKEEAIQKAKLSDFWVFVRLDKENEHTVCGVFACRGGDEVLLVPGNTHWWYEPWYPTKDEKVRKKWDKQKDKDGWQLITKCLSKGR